MDEGEPKAVFGSYLTGNSYQFPDETTEAGPGIGKEEDIKKNAKDLLDPAWRDKFHPVSASLVFLCLIFNGLHSAFKTVGVSETSGLLTPKEGRPKGTRTLHKKSTQNKADAGLTATELTLLLCHCCDLFIGLAIGSSDKFRVNNAQVHKHFQTLMVSLQKKTISKCNPITLYNAGHAVDWINSKPWIGQLVLNLTELEAESPAKELIDQMRLVANKAQMTTCFSVQAYLEQCMGGTIAMRQVVAEIPKFEAAVSIVKRKTGSMFEFASAIRHPAIISLAPRNFPNLSTAANYWKKWHSPSCWF
ncbi:LOW QUALITY PROTEIN: endogenous Bornavirus-like nucleoprotein 1 [Liasis olivaceus]